jgi:hypothetical protein
VFRFDDASTQNVKPGSLTILSGLGIFDLEYRPGKAFGRVYRIRHAFPEAGGAFLHAATVTEYMGRSLPYQHPSFAAFSRHGNGHKRHTQG